MTATSTQTELELDNISLLRPAMKEKLQNLAVQVATGEVDLEILNHKRSGETRSRAKTYLKEEILVPYLDGKENFEQADLMHQCAYGKDDKVRLVIKEEMPEGSPFDLRYRIFGLDQMVAELSD